MSRREALRSGGAALVATVAMDPADALARVTRRCRHHEVKCNGKCCPPGEVCLHPKKRKHHRRPKPRCGCPAGTVRCKGKCVHLKADVHNCGSCGHKCGPGQMCTKGRCIASCPPGEAFCAGACVNVTANPAHCGTCGNKCTPGGVCHQGGCLNVCPPGYTECQGGCVDFGNDPKNCGGCGNACGSGAVCANGTCAGGCPSGQTICGGICVSPAKDPNNCGACGHVCANGQACVDGTCSSSCPSGQTQCSRFCVNTKGDASNCGGCGTACPTGQVCSGGTCTSGTCASGTVDCSGSCCAGSACCGSGCQTQHNTGMSGYGSFAASFYDCSSQGVPGNFATYSKALAQEAAAAVFPGAAQAVVDCPQNGASAIQVSTSSGGFALWSYSGGTAGYVHYDTAPYCPSTLDPTWG
jgi:hypothetical protein